MSIIVACECGRKFRAKEEHVGKRTKCPICGRSLVIAAQATSTSGEDTPPSSQSSAMGVSASRSKKEVAIRAEVVAKPSTRQAGKITSQAEVAGQLPCFFCQKTPHLVDYAHRAKMFIVEKATGEGWGAVQRGLPRLLGGVGGLVGGLLPSQVVVYRKCTIRIPRCAGCAARHERIEQRQKRWILIPAIVCGIVSALPLMAIGLFAMCKGEVLPGIIIMTIGGGMVFVLVMLLGVLVASTIEKTLRPRKLGANAGDVAPAYPLIKELVSQGWLIGEKPNVKEGVKLLAFSETIEQEVKPTSIDEVEIEREPCPKCGTEILLTTTARKTGCVCPRCAKLTLPGLEPFLG
jgi:hypothetical protein